MPRQYYFDNQLGHALYAHELQTAGVRITRRAMGQSPISIFLKYKHILDPNAEITHDPANKDAIRLIEVIKPDESQTRCLLTALDKIKVTKNTIVVNFFEPFNTLPLVTERGIKCISLPWGEKDTALSKSIPFTYPLLTAKEDDDCSTFAKVDYFRNLDKPYKFLNLCNKVLPWKLMLHAGLHQEGLIDQGLVSLRWRTGTIADDWAHFNRYSGLKYWDTALSLFKSKQVLDLGEDMDPMTARKRYSHNPNWYDSAWISLVTESNTSSTNDYPYITEKTIAPITAGHPFVIFGDNDTPQTLKNIGFDVFEWLFEHIQLTDQQRQLSRYEQDVIKVNNVLNDVKNFSKEMILDNQTLVREAIKHNQNIIDTGYLKIVAEEWQRVIGELT
jgi:hypothetical protein